MITIRIQASDTSNDTVQAYPEFLYTEDVKNWDRFFRGTEEECTSQRSNLKRKSGDEHSSDSIDTPRKSRLKLPRRKSNSKVSTQTNTLTQQWQRDNSQDETSYYTQSVFTSSSFKQRKEHRPGSMVVNVISRHSVEKVNDDATESKCITCSSWTDKK